MTFQKQTHRNRNKTIAQAQAGIRAAQKLQVNIAKHKPQKDEDPPTAMQRIGDFFRRLWPWSRRRAAAPPKTTLRYRWVRPESRTREKDRAKVKRRKMAYASKRINRRNGSAKR